MSDFNFLITHAIPRNVAEISLNLEKFHYQNSDIKLQVSLSADPQQRVVEYSALDEINDQMHTVYRLDDKAFPNEGSYLLQLKVTFDTETVVLKTWYTYVSGRSLMAKTLDGIIYTPVLEDLS